MSAASVVDRESAEHCDVLSESPRSRHATRDACSLRRPLRTATPTGRVGEHRLAACWPRADRPPPSSSSPQPRIDLAASRPRCSSWATPHRPVFGSLRRPVSSSALAADGKDRAQCRACRSSAQLGRKAHYFGTQAATHQLHTATLRRPARPHRRSYRYQPIHLLRRTHGIGCRDRRQRRMGHTVSKYSLTAHAFPTLPAVRVARAPASQRWFRALPIHSPGRLALDFGGETNTSRVCARRMPRAASAIMPTRHGRCRLRVIEARCLLSRPRRSIRRLFSRLVAKDAPCASPKEQTVAPLGDVLIARPYARGPSSSPRSSPPELFAEFLAIARSRDKLVPFSRGLAIFWTHAPVNRVMEGFGAYRTHRVDFDVSTFRADGPTGRAQSRWSTPSAWRSGSVPRTTTTTHAPASVKGQRCTVYSTSCSRVCLTACARSAHAKRSAPDQRWPSRNSTAKCSQRGPELPDRITELLGLARKLHRLRRVAAGAIRQVLTTGQGSARAAQDLLTSRVRARRVAAATAQIGKARLQCRGTNADRACSSTPEHTRRSQRARRVVDFLLNRKRRRARAAHVDGRCGRRHRRAPRGP